MHPTNIEKKENCELKVLRWFQLHDDCVPSYHLGYEHEDKDA